MPVRGVLFDVDDTLFDYSTSEELGLLGHLTALGMLDLFPSPGGAVEVWRQIMEEEYARFLAGELDFTEQQRTRTRRFLAHVGCVPDGGLSDEDASAWFAGYGVHRDAAWSAFPDAEPVLKALAADHHLGIVSNSSLEHQRRKLDRIGLLPYFGDAVVCSEEHGAAKPSPSVFLAGCESLGLPPHEVAYVGDKYEVDGLGARDAGLTSYWLDRAGTGTAAADGVQVIRSLDDLPAALARQAQV